MDIKQLRETVDNLFSKRTQFMLLCQEIAENFYPQRADFTLRRDIGDEFAENLMTSFPVLTHRDLTDQIGVMLRPTQKEWFHMAPTDPDREDNAAKRWLEMAGDVQRRVMYDPRAQFTRATKEGDGDFSAFGQCVISARMNKYADGLLYRCWHIRDVVWMETEEGDIGLIARKWKPHARELRRLFGDKNDRKVGELADKQPFDEVECYHIIVEADMYNGDARGKPYWSLYYDIRHEHLIEAVPVWNKEYAIPRWQTVSGSQYAYSPATIVALPDARMIQAMYYTLLEAGEKAVTPPVLATENVVRSDVNLYAGGITWVDADYDERLGDALRPLTQDVRGIPLGIDMMRDSRALIQQAFFLNKLRPFNPAQDPEMTAYQAGQIVQDWIRQAIPLFEPMEMGYNGSLCELTFDLLLRNGAFGSPYDMPASLSDADISFRFESPLHDAIEQQKGQKFLEAKALLAEAMALDTTSAALLDVREALRDALDGIGTPAKWVPDKAAVERYARMQQQNADRQQLLDAAEQSSNVAVNLTQAQREAVGA